MSAASPFRIFTAKEAKTRFGELLDEALLHPVGVSKHDRLMAYLVSRGDFDALLAKISALEDELLLAKAELARREGFVGADRVDALLRKIVALEDAETRDQP
ncbi:MAG: type II toxin-antitoxin system Phd/YefM family antitoxin [Massilia sp.]